MSTRTVDVSNDGGASDCPHCQWSNRYMTCQDGSREAEMHDHMDKCHPEQPPTWKRT